MELKDILRRYKRLRWQLNLSRMVLRNPAIVVVIFVMRSGILLRRGILVSKAGETIGEKRINLEFYNTTIATKTRQIYESQSNNCAL